MDKQRIKDEAEAFFEWPTTDKTSVTTTSMLIFAGVIAQMAAAEEREACAAAAESLDRSGREWVKDSLWANIKRDTAAAIRARSLPANDLGNRRAAFGASVLTDGLCGNGNYNERTDK